MTEMRTNTARVQGARLPVTVSAVPPAKEIGAPPSGGAPKHEEGRRGSLSVSFKRFHKVPNHSASRLEEAGSAGEKPLTPMSARAALPVSESPKADSALRI